MRTRTGPDIPRDRAICQDCVDEVRSPTHPRRGYVLNSCVHCGPRYSVIASMPWDRSRTALASWSFCGRCNTEYQLLEERRGHAQIISCPSCGPRLWLRQRCTNLVATTEATEFTMDQAETADEEQQLLLRAAECIAAGGLIALQGIGGWQLVCDATNCSAVRRLRHLKQRPHKPLAVMIPSLESLDTPLEAAETALLQSPENPMLLYRSQLRPPLSPEVSGPLNSSGIFLPTTALHDGLLQQLQRPLVVSSANVEGAPILTECDTVCHELGDGVDMLLGHQRPILRPIDDSVVRIMAGRTAVLMLGRGFAPLPLPLALNSPAVIVALGGHQKSSFAFAGNGRAVLGPHCGDLHHEEARERFLQQLKAALDLYQLTPTIFVHDMHPDYFTSIWARGQNVPTMTVQHHHAHAAAAMLEAQIDGPALAAAFDGAGYSPDGVIRGGEFLIASRSKCKPVASLLNFQLPAAELATRSPWRSAVAVLQLAVPEWDASRVASWIAGRPAAYRIGPPPNAAQIQQLQQAVSANAGSPCSSMGRIFDALACLILGVHTVDYEAAAAMLLEEHATKAEECGENGRQPPQEVPQTLLPILETEPLTVDWRPLVRTVLAAAEQGRPVQSLARLVHFAIAAGVLSIARRYPTLPVVLTGGCFQNRLLTECTAAALQSAGHTCILPGLIPVNDGGLAAGQLAVAAALLESADRQRPLDR
ncbi:MAG: carbamoyltransferase HypF [Planctomycetaceae bacterium]